MLFYSNVLMLYHNNNYLIINYSIQLKYFPSADWKIFACVLSSFYFSSCSPLCISCHNCKRSAADIWWYSISMHMCRQVVIPSHCNYVTPGMVRAYRSIWYLLMPWRPSRQGISRNDIDKSYASIISPPDTFDFPHKCWCIGSLYAPNILYSCGSKSENDSHTAKSGRQLGARPQHPT